MRVVVELVLQADDGIGLGSDKTYERMELSVQEWSRGNSVSREDYIHIEDENEEHLFDIRMGNDGRVYLEKPNGDIITIRGD